MIKFLAAIMATSLAVSAAVVLPGPPRTLPIGSLSIMENYVITDRTAQSWIEIKSWSHNRNGGYYGENFIFTNAPFMSRHEFVTKAAAKCWQIWNDKFLFIPNNQVTNVVIEASFMSVIGQYGYYNMHYRRDIGSIDQVTGPESFVFGDPDEVYCNVQIPDMVAFDVLMPGIYTNHWDVDHPMQNGDPPYEWTQPGVLVLSTRYSLGTNALLGVTCSRTNAAYTGYGEELKIPRVTIADEWLKIDRATGQEVRVEYTTNLSNSLGTNWLLYDRIPWNQTGQMRYMNTNSARFYRASSTLPW